jgi:prepilin-type N-terminal cleavage/methylation domain-containing protein
MIDQGAKIVKGNQHSGFTIVETLVAILVLSLVMSGVIYGYVQANRIAEFSSMSLAATAYASQGAEQARAADWRPWDWPQTNGPGTMDELRPTNYFTVDTMDIPAKGTPSAADFAFWVTNYVNVTTYSMNPPIRQIRSDCVWRLPWNKQLMTNTVVLLRAPDQ